MTLESPAPRPAPGYAGALKASEPALAQRFQFWRGASGRRYTCSAFPAAAAPAYEGSVVLYVRRQDGAPVLLAVRANAAREAPPADADEVHIHLVPAGEDASEALADLSALSRASRPLLLLTPPPSQPRRKPFQRRVANAKHAKMLRGLDHVVPIRTRPAVPLPHMMEL
jgi:hypothetical protein